MTELSGAERIAVERARQLLEKDDGGEGWNAEHDRGHSDELALAAVCYALPQASRDFFSPVSNGGVAVQVSVRLVRFLWPWTERWWKPTPGNRIRELEKAGALIAAAIDDELLKEGAS